MRRPPVPPQSKLDFFFFFLRSAQRKSLRNLCQGIVASTPPYANCNSLCSPSTNLEEFTRAAFQTGQSQVVGAYITPKHPPIGLRPPSISLHSFEIHFVMCLSLLTSSHGSSFEAQVDAFDIPIVLKLEPVEAMPSRVHT